MKHDVERHFDNFIKGTFPKPEVCHYLINHERKPKVLNAICEQIRIAEISNISQTFNIYKYQMLIEECSKMFCEAALEYEKQQSMSNAEKQRRINEANVHEYAKDVLTDLEEEAKSKKLVSRPGEVAK